MAEKQYTKTLRIRVRDKHIPVLRSLAREVNFAWNYCNDLAEKELKRDGKFLSKFDLTAKGRLGGASLVLKELEPDRVHLPQKSYGEIAQQFVVSRKEKMKRRKAGKCPGKGPAYKLRWRVSNRESPKYSLGWVPFQNQSIARCDARTVKFASCHWKLMHDLPDVELRAGEFIEDRLGRWFLCVAVKVEVEQGAGTSPIGIDLGLHDIATTSDADRLPAGQWRRNSQAVEGRLQRAIQRGKDKHGKASLNKKRRLTRLHARTAARRKDAHHKFSRSIVNRASGVYVGNVSPTKLAKTKMAKSIYDAGWASLKTMLEYKCEHAGIEFREVDEAYSTQACSACGVISSTSPKGRAGLGIREWMCESCGAEHDRDVNAARNILISGVGHGPPVGGNSRQNGALAIGGNGLGESSTCMDPVATFVEPRSR